MRRTTTLLLAVVFLLLSCDESATTGPGPMVMADDYRLSRILSYPNSGSHTATSGLEFRYSENGDLIKELLIDYPNTVSTYKDYEYVNNRKAKVKIYDGQVGNLTMGTYIEYFYTDDQLTKEELHLGDGTLKYSTHYQYEGGKLVNTYKEGDDLGIHHQYKYSFDSQGRLLLEQVYMYDEELSEFIKYFYDDHDRIIKTEWYDHTSTLTGYMARKYEGSGNLPELELQYDNHGALMQTRQLTYDQWGNLAQVTVSGQGPSCTLFKEKYNGQLLMEKITYSPAWGCVEWTVSRYEYSKK
jgi:hypothetical protein